MFTIKANYSDTVEVNTNLENVREFFSDIKNFVELMPGVESIHTDAKGVTHWTIRAEIPIVGAMMQKFAVELSENDEERIEWSPVAGETKNLLRYAADFLEKGKNLTLVHFSQVVEMRRNSARELHLLAGLAGESIISNEMSKKIAEMIKIFVRKAKEKLEK
ncbi:MAG TPA: SRPBCC domain-containing protein [Pyrinomonadaceae bacterium]|jgi:carbon monoxide dehydrogenase subunit G